MESKNTTTHVADRDSSVILSISSTVVQLGSAEAFALGERLVKAARGLPGRDGLHHSFRFRQVWARVSLVPGGIELIFAPDGTGALTLEASEARDLGERLQDTAEAVLQRHVVA